MIMNGRFDFSAHREFKVAYSELLPQKNLNRLVLNFADVIYLDSSALGMLLLLKERAEVEHKVVELSRANSTIKQIFDISNFGKLFTIN